jgi:hypothetical protein
VFSIFLSITVQFVLILFWRKLDLMGNSQAKKREAEYSGNVEARNKSTVVSPRSQQQEEEVSFNIQHHYGKKKLSTKEKYALIPDNFTTLEQVSYFCFLYLFCIFLLCFLCGFRLPNTWIIFFLVV